VGSDVYFRGLPFTATKADLKTVLGPNTVTSITMDRKRKGTATVRFPSRRRASQVILDFDNRKLLGRKCRAAAAKMYFRQPSWSAMFEDDDGLDAESFSDDAVVPVTFAGRGSKEHEHRSKAVNKKWRTLFCQICGLRGT